MKERIKAVFKDKIILIIAMLMCTALLGYFISRTQTHPYQPFGAFGEYQIQLPAETDDGTEKPGTTFPTFHVINGSELLPVEAEKCVEGGDSVTYDGGISWALVQPQFGLSISATPTGNVAVLKPGCNSYNYSIAIPPGVTAVLQSLKEQGINRSQWVLNAYNKPISDKPVETKNLTSQTFIISYDGD